MKKQKEQIFEEDDDPSYGMEMPCMCDCGELFDQPEGNASVNGKLICDACYSEECSNIERLEEIRDLVESIESAKDDIRRWEAKLEQLNYNPSLDDY